MSVHVKQEFTNDVQCYSQMTIPPQQMDESPTFMNPYGQSHEVVYSENETPDPERYELPWHITEPAASQQSNQGDLEQDYHGGKARRSRNPRSSFTSVQLHYLNSCFQKTQHLSLVERQQLGTRLGLSPYQIKVWFQNRRVKHRREVKAGLIEDTVTEDTAQLGSVNEEFSLPSVPSLPSLISDILPSIPPQEQNMYMNSSCLKPHTPSSYNVEKESRSSVVKDTITLETSTLSTPPDSPPDLSTPYMVSSTLKERCPDNDPSIDDKGNEAKPLYIRRDINANMPQIDIATFSNSLSAVGTTLSPLQSQHLEVQDCNDAKYTINTPPYSPIPKSESPPTVTDSTGIQLQSPMYPLSYPPVLPHIPSAMPYPHATGYPMTNHNSYRQHPYFQPKKAQQSRSKNKSETNDSEARTTRTTSPPAEPSPYHQYMAMMSSIYPYNLLTQANPSTAPRRTPSPADVEDIKSDLSSQQCSVNDNTNSTDPLRQQFNDQLREPIRSRNASSDSVLSASPSQPRQSLVPYLPSNSPPSNGDSSAAVQPEFVALQAAYHNYMSKVLSRYASPGVPSSGENMWTAKPKEDKLPDHGSAKKKVRRQRSVYSPEQVDHLSRCFKKDPYMSLSDRQRLAASLQLTQEQVLIWFQNRRSKIKKAMKDEKFLFDISSSMGNSADKYAPPGDMSSAATLSRYNHIIDKMSSMTTPNSPLESPSDSYSPTINSLRDMVLRDSPFITNPVSSSGGCGSPPTICVD